MKNYVLMFCSVMCLQWTSGVSQVDTTAHRINIIGEYLNDHQIVLRWVPSSPSLWTMSRYYGFRLERCEVDTLTGVQSKWMFPTDSILKPLSLERWKEEVRNNPDDLYLQAAGQAHHGERGPEPRNMDEMIRKSDELNNLYSAAVLSAEFSPLAANASALRFEDNSVQQGKLYIYRIRSLCPTTVMESHSGVASVTTFEIRQFPAVVFTQIYEGENLVELSWDKAIFQQFYSAFNIYRKPEQGGSWKKLNDLPVAYTGVKNPDLFYFRDSLEANYTPYLYKVEGLTPYSTKGEMSSEVKAMGRDRTPPTAPYNIRTHYLGDHRMEVSWEVDPADKDISGFRVSRTHVANEQFLELTHEPLPPSTRTFIDTSCNELIDNYYYVGIFDKEGNVNVGFPTYGTIIDSVPPAPPVGLTGSIDTNGVVTLSWQPGLEADLKGYYVHSSNRADQTFINLTGHPVQDTVWHDTIPLNVLTESIYYRLVAIDMRYNYSLYSAVLELKKPDQVPPVSPVLISVRNEHQRVMLDWYNSTSLDVSANILQRKAKSDSTYVEVYRCSSSQPQTHYEDTDVSGGVEYVYRVVALDDDGLYSPPSGEMNIRAYQPKVLLPVQDLNATVLGDNKKVELNWSYPDDGQMRYAIYRSVNGSLFTSYKVVHQAHQFIDSPFRAGDVVMYKLKVINDNGWQSDFSMEAVAKIPAQD